MRAICILLSVTLPALALGQSAPAQFTTTGAFFALSVPDLAASTRWYSEKLGLRIVMRSANGVPVNVLEGGGLIVELVQRDGARSPRDAMSADSPPDLVRGIFKVGVIVEDFDGTVARLRAKGVEIVLGPYPPTPEQRANMLVKDNAGNLIQFFGK